MSAEVIILVMAWILTIIMLFILVPKAQLREAQVIFFFKQLITCFIGLLVAQYGLIEYPVREFSRATKASFSFEFFVYPSICVIFNLHYPVAKTPIRQFMHYFYYCTAITVFEVFCEKYTMVIQYIHWTWYITWITLFITFYISRKYYVWFFKLDSKDQEQVFY